VGLLKRMVGQARAEIARRERALASVAERLPGFLGAGGGASDPGGVFGPVASEAGPQAALEGLERLLSDRERTEAALRKDLADTQAQLAERNERIADLCAEFERAQARVAEAGARELREVSERARRLEEVELPELRRRAEVAEGREGEARTELGLARARVEQVEAVARARLEKGERAMAEARGRSRELELDLEHVMAAAAKYTRRAVLQQHDLAPASDSGNWGGAPPAVRGPEAHWAAGRAGGSPLPAGYEPVAPPFPGATPAPGGPGEESPGLVRSNPLLGVS